MKKAMLMFNEVTFFHKENTHVILTFCTGFRHTDVMMTLTKITYDNFGDTEIKRLVMKELSTKKATTLIKRLQHHDSAFDLYSIQ